MSTNNTHTVTSTQEFRKHVRNGKWNDPTSGACPGYLQANMVILPKTYADDFKQFCELNNQACPLMAVLPPGEVCPHNLAEGADVRTDIPRYRVYRNGEMEREATDISDIFTPDMVTFLLGCSFSFEQALIDNGISVRNIDMKRNVSMYKTNQNCYSVGLFSCPLVVSMRPIDSNRIQDAVKITSHFTDSHGAPVHIGKPQEIGVDINQVDFGDTVPIYEGEEPVFWACGVTAIMSAIAAKAPITITHSPGYMFVTDLPEPKFNLD